MLSTSIDSCDTSYKLSLTKIIFLIPNTLINPVNNNTTLTAKINFLLMVNLFCIISSFYLYTELVPKIIGKRYFKLSTISITISNILVCNWKLYIEYKRGSVNLIIPGLPPYRLPQRQLFYIEYQPSVFHSSPVWKTSAWCTAL